MARDEIQRWADDGHYLFLFGLLDALGLSHSEMFGIERVGPVDEAETRKAIEAIKEWLDRFPVLEKARP